MQLPTDQYVLIPLPNNAKLEKTSNGLFTLLVPELQIFNVWLRPHVVSSVDVTPSGVFIQVFLRLVSFQPYNNRALYTLTPRSSRLFVSGCRVSS